MTVRREIAEPRRETGARSREDPVETKGSGVFVLRPGARRLRVHFPKEMGSKEMGSGMSIDLSRCPTNALPTWHSCLESSRLTSGFPSWQGNLRKISVLGKQRGRESLLYGRSRGVSGERNGSRTISRRFGGSGEAPRIICSPTPRRVDAICRTP
jgi:hypothetical protein